MLLTVRRQALLMQRIAESTLDTGGISGIGAGSRPALAEKIDLIDVADEVRDILMPLLNRQGQILEVEAQTNDLHVRADRLQICQVLINLLLNASKYSGPGTITVRLTSRGDYSRVTVCDRGNGIAPEEREALFERSYRSSHQDNNSTPGFGLGLFIAREVVEAHQGRIGIAPRSLGGTRCWFEIPRFTSDTGS
jgi:signal transduction histidine kinase